MRHIVSLLVVGACLAAFAVRSYPAHRHVFGEPGFVNLSGNDAWAHARAVETLVHNFPRRMVFDPFTAWPTGYPSAVAPLFDFLVAGAAMVLGRGDPSEQLPRTLLAWAPVLFAALIPLPVFALTRRLFVSLGAALAAAWVVALIPGHFQAVSQLGFGDHHSLEGLLAVVAMWALVAALPVEERARPWRLAIAGGAWWAYLETWVAGSLLVAVVVAWAALEILRRPAGTLALRTLTPILLIAWVAVELSGSHVWSLATRLSLLGGAAGLMLLHAASRIAERRGVPIWAALTVPAGLAAVAVALAAPEQLAFVADKLKLLAPDDRFQTVAEMRPLLRFDGPWFWTPVWEQFRLAFPLAVVGCAVLWRRRAELSSPAVRLLLVWTGAMLLLTLSQMRASYYLAITLAILSGLALDALAGRLAAGRRHATLALLVVATALPSLQAARELQGGDHPVLRDYRKAYQFLRDETPPPFGDEQAYYARFEAPAAGRPFAYPDGAYGVMNWWDNGHRLTVLGRRIPVSNPFQAGVETAAAFFLERDPAAAIQQLRRLRAPYVLVGPDLLMNKLGMITPEDAKIDTMHPWVGADRDEMYRLVRREADGEPLLVFFPPYFETMAVRLALYAGQAAEADRLDLVRLERRDGEWLLLDSRTATSQEEAAAHLAANDGWRLASLEPYRTCVELEAVDEMELVFKSQFRSVLAAKVFRVIDSRGVE